MSAALAAHGSLTAELIHASNATGGWGYERGKSSRIEPTCWAILAARATPPSSDLAVHRAFLERCQRPDGWLTEDPRWPINIAFNALVAFTWLTQRELATGDRLQHLLNALVSSKGVQAPPSPSYRQDNSLQGWAWIDATFSWVEPTAWGVLALKKAARSGFSVQGAPARVAEAERMLVDRCCKDGGWNFGNSNVLGQDLAPHVPTTALALIALQDRQAETAVTRSVAFLEAQWPQERSVLALGLSLTALQVHRRPIDSLQARLREHLSERRLANTHGLAVATTALTDHATFRL